MVQSSIIGWINKIADLLQSHCDKFNQTAGGALYVSMTAPAFVTLGTKYGGAEDSEEESATKRLHTLAKEAKPPEHLVDAESHAMRRSTRHSRSGTSPERLNKTIYQTRLSASFWDLVIRGSGKNIEFLFVPAEKVISSSRSIGRVRAAARMTATRSGGSVLWKLDGKPVADDSLETLCRDLFTTLIQLYLDEDHPAQVVLQRSPSAEEPPAAQRRGRCRRQADDDPIVDLGTYIDISHFLSKLERLSADCDSSETDGCQYVFAADSAADVVHRDVLFSPRHQGNHESIDTAIQDISELVAREIEVLSSMGAEACRTREFTRAEQARKEVVRLIELRQDLAALGTGCRLQG